MECGLLSAKVEKKSESAPPNRKNRERLRKMGTVAGTVAKKVVVERFATPFVRLYIRVQETERNLSHAD